MTEEIELPLPEKKGSSTLEKALMARRTLRTITEKELPLEQVFQLLWASYEITTVDTGSQGHEFEHRTVPSAGGQFPLVIHTLVAHALFPYDSVNHRLVGLEMGDFRSSLAEMRLTKMNRVAIHRAPPVAILTVNNQRAMRNSPSLESVLSCPHLEAGHASQNLSLHATVLGLELTKTSSFDVAGVRHHRPIYLAPIGRPIEVVSGGLDCT